MSIQIGKRLPKGSFKVLAENGIKDLPTEQMFEGQKAAVFGLPGAYTPVCSTSHLPGFVENFDKLKAAGFDEIACISVNDPFVIAAWGKEYGADGKARMLRDTDGAYTKALGLVADLGAFGLHGRSERYSMVVDNGFVQKIEVEKTVFDHDGTSAACMLQP